jgi:arginine decarboxylase
VTMIPSRAPLLEALEAYRARKVASFHVPGHKAGMSYSSAPEAAWLGTVGAYDATELPGLDDLHAPNGPIAQAQALASDCYGADQSYFLIGGSTVGNLAAIHAAAARGDMIIMQRNVHKSAIHALMLSGIGAVFVTPEKHSETQRLNGVSAASVEEALERYPEAKAVFLTNPNYYGMTMPLERIAQAAHVRGIPLIVDEAHGAHFGFHRRFPMSALQSGADVVIQSTHKMLSAMTMGAMLHVKGTRMDRGLLELYLRMLQSSSPSYPILASIDWARREVHTKGEALFGAALTAIDHMEQALADHPRFALYRTHDPLKPLLYDRTDALSGFTLLEALAEIGIYAEMADERFVVCACSSATTLADIDNLLQALDVIFNRFPDEKKEIRHNFSNTNLLQSPSLSKPVYVRSRTDLAASEVDVESAAGAYSAEMVIPYPPGIPLLYPGEPITEEAVDALLRLREEGARVQGVMDRTLRTIRVWREPF